MITIIKHYIDSDNESHYHLPLIDSDYHYHSTIAGTNW